ncbi:MAG: hypothetical protein QX189_00725 [Methylococcales bacterium]
MKTRYLLTTAFALLLSTLSANAQNYTVSKTGTFAPQHKTVLLLKDKDSASSKNIILFQTNLRVNTDGSPLSYHPQDLRGQDKALNNICNAIAVRKGTSKTNLCLSKNTFGEAIEVFEKFRDSDFVTIPQGYQITWKNVLATTQDGKPCVFQSGQYKGYFGSLTALTNGLTKDKGECEVNNQINSITVPALVLVGGKNVVKDFGAKVGDVLVAYNPKTQLSSSAIIGDTGPADNLGEGSIFLNMKLLGTTTVPSNKKETYTLSIEDQVLIAIIPASKVFANKPYTADSINQGVEKWLKESGFKTPDKFIEFMKSFQPKL